MGYLFTGFRSKFTVPAKHLIKSASNKVKVECDYCKKIVSKDYKSLMDQRKSGIVNKDCCTSCKGIKQKEGCVQKYGVDCTMKLKEAKDKSLKTIKEKYGEHVENVFQATSIKSKIKDTNLKKYGVENIMTSEEFREKMTNTTLERYGVKWYTQTDEYKKRVKETNLERYGVENVFQNEDIKQKIRETCMDRYGVEHPMQNEEIHNARLETNLKKYGYITPAKNHNVIAKMKKTNLKKYGNSCTLASKKIKEKVKQSMLSRYGYEYPGQVPEIIEKRNETMRANGTVPTSSQQLAIFNMLKEHGYNTELNYTFSRSIFDIALFIDDIKIDVEYDAAYFHQDQKFDRKRDEYVKSQGWKVLRVKSGHLLPAIDQLEESINKLIHSERKYTEIVLDDWTLKVKGVESRLA